MCARRFESRVHRIVPSLEQRIHDTRGPHHAHDTTRRWDIAIGISLSAFPPSILVHRMQTAPLSSTKLPISSPREGFIDHLQRIEASRTTRPLVALIKSSAQITPFCFLCAAGAGEEKRKTTVQALCCVCMDRNKSWLQAEDDSMRRLLSSRRTKPEWIKREDGEPRACRVARWARRFGTRTLVDRQNVRAGDPG